MTRKDALQAIKAKMDYYESDKRLRRAIETLIPEFAESEDVRIIDDAIQIIRASRLRCAEYGSEADKHLKAIAWLEKQKEPENTSASTMAPSCWEVEQKEQKPEWSEEDEAMRDNILRLLSCSVGTLECDSNPSLSTSYPAYQREMDWLKSLRPSWKPSEEQMEAIKEGCK